MNLRTFLREPSGLPFFVVVEFGFRGEKTVKRFLVLILFTTLAVAMRIWFDFSSPLTAYILGKLSGGNGVGFSIGCEFSRFPSIEVSYFDISGRKYVSVKPLMIGGEIKRVKDLRMDLLLSAGIDGGFPDYGLGIYLATGIAGVYETFGRRGVFLKIAFEIGVRMNVFGRDFSPYYIKVLGPFVIRPALIVGGKF